jgi:hypothetical protein
MEKDILTISFVNQDYIELAKNWLNSVNESGYKGEIRIYALDSATVKYFPKSIVEPVTTIIHNLDALWRFRVEVFRSLFFSKTSFVHSDVDAIWIKNPIHYMQDIHTPLIFSQGTIHPPTVFDKFNFVFCCGFFYVSGSTMDKNLAECIAKWTDSQEIHENYDDQTSINEILATVLSSNILNFDRKIIDSQVGKFTVFNDDLVMNHISGNLPFTTLLPHFRFPRVLREHERPDWVVAHPLTPKNAVDKIDFLKRNKLWIAKN